MSEPSCSRETIADCATLESFIALMNENGYVGRTRNRMGGNLWECSRPTYPNPKVLLQSWSLAVGPVQFQ